MLKKYWFLIVFFYPFFCSSLQAIPIDLDSALTVGETHLEAVDKEIAKKAQVKSLEGKSLISKPDYSMIGTRELKDEDGTLLGYILDLAPEGFIFISPDTDIEPVIAYSYSGKFSLEDTSDNTLLYLLREDLNKRLYAISALPQNLKHKNNNLWQDYLSGEEKFLEKLSSTNQWPSDDRGWLKLDTSWCQQSPYNNKCPLDPLTGERVVVGCVATALAQIVDYWEKPTALVLDSNDKYISCHYYNEHNTSKLINIDDSRSDLDFPSFVELNSVLSNIDYNNLNDTIRAYLCFGCGIIVKMNYSFEGSGISSLSGVEEALKSKLGYKSADFCNENDPLFYHQLIGNMKSAQPAMIAVIGPNGGHAIVVDGYRDSGAYHLNFGWRENDPKPITNCWYLLPLSTENPADDFTFLREGVLNISPAKVELFSPVGGEIWSGTKNISWRTSYSYNTDLWVDIYFSNDSGNTWTLIASNEVDDGGYQWNTSDALDGNQCRIKIVAKENGNNVGYTICNDDFAVDNIGAKDERYVYISNRKGENISVLSTASNSIVEKYDLAFQPLETIVTPDGNYIYATTYRKDYIAIINTETRYVTYLDTDHYNYGITMTPDGNYVYVTQYWNNSIGKISTSEKKLVKTIKGFSRPDYGIAISPDGNYLYVANYSGDSVFKISTTTDTLSASISAGDKPEGIVITPDGAYVYVANYGDGTVSKISTSTNLVEKTIGVRSNPYDITVSPDGSEVFVTNYLSNRISVISTSSDTVIKEIRVGSKPYGVSISPDGNVAYVSNFNSNTISLISMAYKSSLGLIDTDGGPWGITISPPLAKNHPPEIALSSPIGGETWTGIRDVTWNATDQDEDDIPSISAYYSGDSGSTWTKLVENSENDGSYSWDTTGVPNKSTYRIRVVASDGELTASDGSETNFTINNNIPPVVSLNEPRGGETWSGTTQFEWSATDENQDDELSVDLYYSVNSGNDWTELASNEQNDGVYEWNTTVLSNGSHYRVKVEVSDGQVTVEDLSPADFTVHNNTAPEIVLSSPVGGETWSGTEEITWSATDADASDTVTIDVYYSTSTQSGDNWTKLAENEENDGSYSLDTTVLPNKQTYRVRVVASDGELTAHDETETDFTIDNNTTPVIRLTAPRGGETWSGTYEIKWSATDEDIGDILKIGIYYSVDSGSNWVELATEEENDGVYLWNTGVLSDGSNYRVKVMVSDGLTTAKDSSPEDFSIKNNSIPGITLNAPIGGETWSGTEEITWTATDADISNSLSLDIYYSSNSGSTWLKLACNEENDGQFSWDTKTVPNDSSYRVKVEVSDGKNTVNDSSDFDFTIDNNIPPVITLSAPRGGEHWAGIEKIQWDAHDDDSEDTVTVDIHYSSNSGSNWVELASNEVNNGLFSWDTTTVTNGSTYRIKVLASDDVASDFDASPADFTVNNNAIPTITLTAPNGGETWSGTKEISWTATDADTEDSLSVDIFFSDNNGTYWFLLAANEANDGLYEWDTTGLADGSFYLVKIVVTDNKATTEVVSEYNFTIRNSLEENIYNVYISNASGNNLYVIDSLSNAVSTTIDVGEGPAGVTVSPEGFFTFSVNNTANSVSVIDNSTNQVFRTYEVGTNPYSIAVAPFYYCYVSNAGTNTVSVIDLLGDKVLYSLDVGNTPAGITVSPNGDYVFVANYSSNTISVIYFWTDQVLGAINVGSYPYDVAVSPDGNYIYVCNSGDNTVSVISFQVGEQITVEITDTIDVGSGPTSLAISPDGSHVYVTNALGNSVSVIDTNINSVISTITVGDYPIDITVTQDGKTCYVANLYGNSVSVIDTTGNSVSDTIEVEANPRGIAITPALTTKKAPRISLNSPKGGESWSGTESITWSASDPNGETLEIAVYYSSDSGENWTEFATEEENDGLYQLDMTAFSNGSSYRIKVVADDGELTASAESKSDFTIFNNTEPLIILTDPLGDESWGETVEIAWVAIDLDGETLEITIEYSADSGENWATLAQNEEDDGQFPWDTSTVPNGSNYRIKVIASDGSAVVEYSSLADFTISNNAPPILVLSSPVGGETWTGMSQIQWVASDADDDVVGITIELSKDSGDSWETLSANEVNDGFLSWDTSTVPNGSNYRVKVIASDSKAVVEVSSSSDFTIHNNTPPVLSLSFPRGKEILSGAVEIKWTASDADDDPVGITIEYSPNGGDSWELLSANEANDGLFAWDTRTVSNGSSYRVKVTASDGQAIVIDSSPSDFTVDNNAPPVITLNTPVGGETCTGTAPISWSAIDPDPNDTLEIDIYYSASSGTNWIKLSENQENNDSYLWNTTNLPNKETYRVRVIAYDGNLSSSDESGNDFTVHNNTSPVVALSAPVGEEIWSRAAEIKWSATDADDDLLGITLEYSADSGNNWSTIAGNEDNDGLFTWETNAVPNGSNYRVKITASDGQVSVQDTSPADFTVYNNAPPIISLNAPAGGEHWSGVEEITWTCADEDAGDELTIDIYYSFSGGNNWVKLASSEENDGSYIWDTSSLPNKATYRVRLEANDGKITAYNESASNFTIYNNHSPEIVLEYPEGGESMAGSVKIVWTATDIDKDLLGVTIEYSADSGFNWDTLSSGEENDGSYLWDTTSYPNSDNYRIKVIVSDGNLSDEAGTDVDFSVSNVREQSISGTVSPGGIVVELYYEGGKIDETYVSDDDYNGSGTYSFTGLFGQGFYSVRAYSRISDTLGYYPEEKSATFSGSSAVVDFSLESVPVIDITDKSAAYYGEADYLDGLVKPGDVVTVEDIQGVVCGVFIVGMEGEYGLVTVYGDETGTPEDEGAIEGENLNFHINLQTVQVFGPEEATWEDGQVKNINISVELAGGTIITLHEGWNCISVNVKPVNKDLRSVFGDLDKSLKVMRKYARDGVKVYDPTIPFRFNTMTEVDENYGYQLKLEEPVMFLISGAEMIASNKPLDIYKGWNVVPYYGEEEQEIGTYLSEIKDSIDVIRGYYQDGVKVYDPSIPERFNTLTTLKPPFAYQVKMKDTQDTYTLTP